MSNVVSFEHAINGAIERTIIDNLKERGGRWVAEPFLVTIANTKSTPSAAVMPVINEMVRNGILETQKVHLPDKMNRNLQGTLYRLIPEPY